MNVFVLLDKGRYSEEWWQNFHFWVKYPFKCQCDSICVSGRVDASHWAHIETHAASLSVYSQMFIMDVWFWSRTEVWLRWNSLTGRTWLTLTVMKHKKRSLNSNKSGAHWRPFPFLTGPYKNRPRQPTVYTYFILMQITTRLCRTEVECIFYGFSVILISLRYYYSFLIR